MMRNDGVAAGLPIQRGRAYVRAVLALGLVGAWVAHPTGYIGWHLLRNVNRPVICSENGASAGLPGRWVSGG